MDRNWARDHCYSHILPWPQKATITMRGSLQEGQPVFIAACLNNLFLLNNIASRQRYKDGL